MYYPTHNRLRCSFAIVACLVQLKQNGNLGLMQVGTGQACTCKGLLFPDFCEDTESRRGSFQILYCSESTYYLMLKMFA